MRNWKVVKKNNIPFSSFFIYDPETETGHERRASSEREAISAYLEEFSDEYSNYENDEQIVLYVIPDNVFSQYKRSVKKTRIFSITRV